MTFVAARKFGDRIIVMADTMITRPGERRHDIIPGQLKAIVIDLRVSVAFAGHYVTGLDSARACKRCLAAGGALSDVLAILSKCSLGDAEFLVASHVFGAEVLKVSNGRVSAPQEAHWIGWSPVASAISRQSQIADDALASTKITNPHINVKQSEESKFTSSFARLFLRSPQVAEGVGGLAVNLLASPYGHCYQQHAGAYLPGPISIGGPPHPEALAPGGDRYSYNFLASGFRGVGVAGAFMQDAGVGYVYDPLHHDIVKKMAGTTMQAVTDELKRRAIQYGGKPEREC